MTNPICVWDCTIKEDLYTVEELKTHFTCIAKKWCFQLEEGKETGYRHYQGRISLKKKTRLTGIIKQFKVGCRFSPTSKTNQDNIFYVTKEETRLSGPWKDTDPYVPRQIREIKTLYPWQTKVLELSKGWDTRKIHLIIDLKGNVGKSILCTYMSVHGIAAYIPFCNDYKDIMRMVMDMPTKRCYVIDMPRAIKKDKLFQLYSGIETIKNGYAYDDRYNFRHKHFDCPNIFVFTNVIPDLSYLTPDRWTFWTVENKSLITYKIYV